VRELARPVQERSRMAAPHASFLDSLTAVFPFLLILAAAVGGIWLTIVLHRRAEARRERLEEEVLAASRYGFHESLRAIERELHDSGDGPQGREDPVERPRVERAELEGALRAARDELRRSEDERRRLEAELRRLREEQPPPPPLAAGERTGAVVAGPAARKGREPAREGPTREETDRYLVELLRDLDGRLQRHPG